MVILRPSRSTLVGFIFTLLHPEKSAADPSACTALRTADFSGLNTTILDATYHDGPANVTAIGTCTASAQIGTALCRVQFVVNTSSISSILAEAWLPEEWNERFLALGNGGLNGCIDYANLPYGTSLGFASIASNNGHDGDNGRSFANNTEVLADFTSRSIHTETIVGKQLVSTYYGKSENHSYYLGCSTGGRQGLYAALHFPEDFDGILAGAPATNFNHLMGWTGMLTKYVGAPNADTSPSFIPSQLWSVISAEVLRQCDLLDGVSDGIITEPDECFFQPQSLLSNSFNSSAQDCLTGDQVEALVKIYSPLLDQTGKLLYSRFDPGAESGWLAPALVFNGQPFPYTLDWMRYVVENDPNYDFNNFGLDDITRMQALDPGQVSTFSGDFSAFRARGGKILTYHGRADPLIASGNSKRMYDLIARTLREPTLDDFYRLFLIPGMDHCAGGKGSVMFGQANVPLSGGFYTSGGSEASNIFLDLVNWVENGQALDSVIGVSADGSTFRRHCRYPMRSRWNGTEWIC